MSDTNSNHDPYQSLAQRLKRGDAVNGWVLSGPRRRIVQLLKGQRVLDVCCGTGTLTAILIAAGCQAVGVDSSRTMLTFAQRKRIAAKFELMDATSLPFNREFDAAVVSIALHELAPPAREKVWASMRRAVRTGGRLIAVDFTVPRSDSLLARVASSLIEQDERSLLTVHREHYENFHEFMQKGGLQAWVQDQKEPVEEEYDFWGGTIAVIVFRNVESE